MTSRTTWTHELDNKMLVLILRESKIKVNYSAIAEQLSTDEHTCTARAVENRLVRLRASVKDDGEGKGEEDAGNAAPVGRAGKSAKRAAGGEDDGEEGRATKRGRKATITARNKTKKADKKSAEDKEEKEEEQQVEDQVEEGRIKAEPVSVEEEV